jgi:hypothetical protein
VQLFLIVQEQMCKLMGDREILPNGRVLRVHADYLL